MASSTYYERFKKSVLSRLKSRGGVITAADLDEAHKEARGAAGGTQRASNAQTPPVAASDIVKLDGVMDMLPDDDEPMNQDDLTDALEIRGSFEDLKEDLRDMLEKQYGKYISIVATFPDHVIYSQWGTGSSNEDAYWAQSFTGTGDDDDTGEQLIKFGPRMAVERATTFQPVKAEDAGQLTVSLVDPLGDSNRAVMLMFTKAGSPGSGNDADPTMPSNVAKMPADAQKKWKAAYAATYNAAAKKGGEKADWIKAATAFANNTVKAEDSDIAFILTDDTSAPNVLLSDGVPAEGIRTFVSLRLADTPGTQGTIPAWQQYHKLGEFAIEHGVAGKIALSKKQGDKMISNFKSGVLRKPLTLDENHNNAGKALAKAVDMAWGDKDAGLPGKPDPNGKGDILYVKWDYNTYGLQTLSDGQYFNQSPQYEYDYTDKESGKTYGITATGCAVTNNPFTRLRTWQGQEAGEPVVLTDAAPKHDGARVMAEGQGNPQSISLTEWNEMKAKQVALEESNAKLAAKNIQLEGTVNLLQGTDRGHAVKILLDDQVRSGLDPAWANKVRKVLLTLDPAEPATNGVKLSDEAEAEPVNLYDAIVDLVSTVPKRPVNRAPVTSLNNDRRPHNDGAALTDEAIALSEAKYASELLTMAGITKPK